MAHRDFRDLKELGKGFKPEKHLHKYRAALKGIKPKDLHEGVNLLHVEGKRYILAEKEPEGGGGGDKPVIRCWNCTGNPDGTIDCFRIPCPWDPPNPPKNFGG